MKDKAALLDKFLNDNTDKLFQDRGEDYEGKYFAYTVSPSEKELRIFAKFYAEETPVMHGFTFDSVLFMTELSQCLFEESWETHLQFAVILSLQEREDYFLQTIEKYSNNLK